jgi:protein tyrosine/serine phosphatase
MPSTRSTTRAISSTTSSVSSTAASLSKLENVLNARDFASATSKIAPGRMYRSGNPANGTLNDVKTLRLNLGIQQMLDFRSSEEHKEDNNGWSLMLSNGDITCYDVNGDISSLAIDRNAALKGVDLPTCELHRLSLLERDRFIKALLWRLPPLKVVQAVGYKIFGYEEQMRATLVPEINRGGLPLVYKILMDTAAADIRRSLELVVEGAERQTPQLIFCRLGKDRTGLVSALILAACGATDEEIIADYIKSDGVDDVALGGLEKMKETQGMDQRLFASAPPEAMKEILEYAKSTYGGMKQYMKSIGFDEGKQEKLAKALCSETEWTLNNNTLGDDGDGK